MTDSPLIAIATLASFCAASQWLAWRLKQPSIVFLLLSGLLVGPITGLLDPDKLFGDLLFPFVSMSVAIILFEGGLTLKLSDIKGHGAVVTRLITLGVLVTWLMLTVTVHFIFSLPWALSFVFGSIAVVSGPTVIKPLLRAVRPNEKIAHLLHWEGILIDPVGVFLALLVFQYVLLGQPSLAAPIILLTLAKLIIVGMALGIASGYATTFVLRHYLVPDYLKNMLTLMVVLIVFAIAETIQHESGLLAVTVMGIWLANAKGLHVDEILHFKENLSILLISTLFIVLAARVDLQMLPLIGGGALLLILIAQCVIRPINVYLCTLGSGLNTNERIFLAWIAPRGIVAAAVSSLFALRLQEINLPQTEYLVPLTFSLIIGTVLLQSFTAKPLADRLGISNPEPNGVLIQGIHETSLALAEALQKHNIKVQFSDTSWSQVRIARQAGFNAYHGNPTSGHAEENLELQGIGKLLALSTSRDTNALVGLHFRKEFGSDSVYTLESASDDEAYERFDTANRNRANPLFDSGLTSSALRRRISSGTIRHIVVPDPAKTPEAAVETQDETNDASQITADEPLVQPNEENTTTLAAKDSDLSQATELKQRDTEQAEMILQGEQPDSAADNEIKETDLRLFAVNKEGYLYIYGSAATIAPKPGWTIIVLTEATPEQTSIVNDQKDG